MEHPVSGITTTPWRRDRLDAVAELLARGVLRVLGGEVGLSSEAGTSQGESGVLSGTDPVDSFSDESVHVRRAESGTAPRREA